MTAKPADEPFDLVVFSFGFKHGVPDDVTMMFDVRFLPNPYWEENMRHLNGLDGSVADYVLKSDTGLEFLEKLEPFLGFLIERSKQAGKSEMRVGIGCTGGQHRSVAVVERLGMCLRSYPVRLKVFHRDLPENQAAADIS